MRWLKVARGGLVHCAELIALVPPRVLPVSWVTVLPRRAGFGSDFHACVRRGSRHVCVYAGGARTRSSSSSVRGWPRSRSTTEACGRFAHTRAATAQPAVPPPTITKSAGSSMAPTVAPVDVLAAPPTALAVLLLLLLLLLLPRLLLLLRLLLRAVVVLPEPLGRRCDSLLMPRAMLPWSVRGACCAVAEGPRQPRQTTARSRSDGRRQVDGIGALQVGAG